MLYMSVVFFVLFTSGTFFVNVETSSTRRKRYVVFPEGSTMSVSFSMAIPTLSVVPTTFSQSINWGIAYELPNDSSTNPLSLLSPKHVLHRKHRRDLYESIEIVMNSLGLDGRSCISRALCEAEQKIFTKGENIIEELLRILFRFPLQRVYSFEPEVHRVYQWARRMGHTQENCDKLFSDCPFSIIDYVLQPLYNI